MKKTVLAIAVVAVVAMGQVTVKGITLGQVLNTAGMKSESGAIWYKETTLGGENGTLVAVVTNDKTVARVMFTPDGRIGKSAVERLSAGIEKQYGITITWRKLKKYMDDISYYTAKDGVEFYGSFEHNQFADSAYKGSFLWEHMEAQAVYKAEAQESANSDF